MASPIPTQLSPGVNVSEVDLSQFVQPVAGNAAGMAGVFNWGPCLVATSVSSESDLAALFGKPTLDQSDTTTSDFLAASNFLRYSSNLRVIRMGVTGEFNSASTDIGITWINSVDNRTIKNEDEFRSLGGFSASSGIETKAHFRGRYPGNFGDSLKVLVYDGGTGADIVGNASTSGNYQDFVLGGGYSPASITGITSGTIGVSFDALIYAPSVSSLLGGGVEVTGPIFHSFGYYVITLNPPNGETPTEFIAQLPNRFETYFATGTTTANYALTQSGSNPSGNAANYNSLKKYGTDAALNPFNIWKDVQPQSLAPHFNLAKVNASNSNLVDIIFLDHDKNNSQYGWRDGQTAPTNPNYIIVGLQNFQVSGLPSNFSGLASTYLGAAGFGTWREIWSNLNDYIYGINAGPTGPIRGWAKLIALTGANDFSNGSNGSTFSVTFDSTSGATGIKRDFAYGIKQFGYDAGFPQVSGREDFSGLRLFDKNPGTSPYATERGGSNDELSVAIIDTLGKFGPKGGILEKFELLSKATDTKNLDGESIFYKDYVNNNSRYVYLTKAFGFTGNGDYTSEATTSFGDIFTQFKSADGITYNRIGYYESILDYGQSSTSDPTLAEKSAAYSIFRDDASAVDILFIPESSASSDTSSETGSLEKAVYDNVIEPRKDTVLVVSSPKPTSTTQHTSVTASRAIDFRNNRLGLPSNSYTFMVAGRKIFYDAFNNQVKRMSLASDVAGILSAQEIPWESPAGFARGSLRNSIKLETQFSKQDRDNLYSNQINFFNEFGDGSGTVLFGDKTLLVKPSAFDRINVRRVFIFLEKAIAAAAKYSLFEFNDEFTRSQFRNLVTPFLNSVVSQRGISDFRIVCDESNNTADVIDRNQFVADIYIKPLKSINFIQLNFIATRSDFSLTTIE